jgi:hypothetical protein
VGSALLRSRHNPPEISLVKGALKYMLHLFHDETCIQMSTAKDAAARKAILAERKPLRKSFLAAVFQWSRSAAGACSSVQRIWSNYDTLTGKVRIASIGVLNFLVHDKAAAAAAASAALAVRMGENSPLDKDNSSSHNRGVLHAESMELLLDHNNTSNSYFDVAPMDEDNDATAATAMGQPLGHLSPATDAALDSALIVFQHFALDLCNFYAGEFNASSSSNSTKVLALDW